MSAWTKDEGLRTDKEPSTKDKGLFRPVPQVAARRATSRVVVAGAAGFGRDAAAFVQLTRSRATVRIVSLLVRFRVLVFFAVAAARPGFAGFRIRFDIAEDALSDLFLDLSHEASNSPPRWTRRTLRSF